MKYIVLFLVFALAFFQEAGDFDDAEKEGVKRRKYCRREIKPFRFGHESVFPGAAGPGVCGVAPCVGATREDQRCCRFYTYGFWATRKCAHRTGGLFRRLKKGFRKSFTAIQFVMNSRYLPYFHLAGFKSTKVVGETEGGFVGGFANRKFMIRLLFFKIIEYRSVDADPRYNFGVDDVVASYDVFKGGRRNITGHIENEKMDLVDWTPIFMKKFEVDGEPVRVLTFRLIEDPKNFGVIRFSVLVVSKALVEKRTNGTIKNIHPPNAMKLSIHIHDIIYQNDTSTGIAIAAMMITRRGVRKKVKRIDEDKIDGGRADPADDNEDTEVMEVEGEEGTENEGAFSFKRWCWLRNITRPDGVTGRVLSENVFHNSYAFDSDQDGVIDQAGAWAVGYKIRVIFFSFPGRPEEIMWDPDLVAYDWSSQIVVSLLLLALVFAVLF